ncbi:DNA circularization protein [Yersinia pekkanenii]|uniref:Bacteriophage protein n=1 Tax=Yersinia pekkanenii TaxID=1288385 RepID=A0A0T9Q3J3_9GAMM|nr:DNA circularization N-terminal domain-containing protein [Yersinia pekkanenii]CNH94565.1 putative bacteriophage protein [Yersinia pekkanenii]CRY68499.1 putative bacteriophage protein [Yersinia pekkanenii]
MSLIGNTLSALLGGSDDSWQWSEHLHQASFRGVPFVISSGSGTFGRRQAVHSYPYRDTSYIEDLGRSARSMVLTGFLVQNSQIYTAPDVMTQRDSLVAACEMAGAATLVHPTLGEMTVSVIDSGLKIDERATDGRVFSFTLTVIESGLRAFAITSSAEMGASIQSSWLGLSAKAVAGFISTVKGEMRSATQAIKTLKSTAAFWGRMVTNTTNEANNLANTLRSTFGRNRYGRYNHGTVGGSSSGATTVVSQQSDTADLSRLVAQRLAFAVEGQAAIEAAVGELLSANSIDGHADQMLLLVNALLNSGISTLDVIRITENLATAHNETFRANNSDMAVADASHHLMTTLCAGAMVQAAAQYQPESYDDAVAVLGRVCEVIDGQALAAADHGNDETYRALLQMRGSIVALLQQAGANLSRVGEVSFNRSLPALMLANRLYQDASRGDALVKMANPIHPAFMPIRFKALNL